MAVLPGMCHSRTLRVFGRAAHTIHRAAVKGEELEGQLKGQAGC